MILALESEIQGSTNWAPVQRYIYEVKEWAGFLGDYRIKSKL